MARRKGLTFYEKKKRISKEMVWEIFSTIFYCFVAVFIAFVLVFSVGMRVSVIGVSMEPALVNGQEVLINKFAYKLASPRRGDVIVMGSFTRKTNPMTKLRTQALRRRKSS